MFLLWYCFDDHLAASLGNAGVGHIDLWIVLLASFVFHGATYARSRS